MAAITVTPESDGVVLTHFSKSPAAGTWSRMEQRVPIIWTACHFGGARPWFVCSIYSNSRYCGRRVALLYGPGQLFACRRCYGLGYSSQQEAPMLRAIGRAQKIRIRLGGSANLTEPFPEKPKGMHWSRYLRLQARAEAAQNSSYALTMQWIDGLSLRR